MRLKIDRDSANENTFAGSIPVALAIATVALGLSVLAGCGPAPMGNARGGADCNKKDGYDAIVVGAGAAGLGAAQELIHLKRSVLVLERNNRVGGRAYVGDVGDAKIDYGGAWIHGVPSNHMTMLVDAAGKHRIRTNLDEGFYTFDGPAKPEDLRLFHEATEEYESALHVGALTDQDKVATHKKDRNDNARSFVPKDKKFDNVRDLVVANAGPLESAAELEKSSAVDSEAFEAGEDDLVEEGFGSYFVDAYTKDNIPVCLQTEVTGIDYSSVPVKVSAKVTNGAATTDAVYSAAHVVVTASVGILKNNPKWFTPALPKEKRESIEHLQMGNLQKVIIPFSADVFKNKNGVEEKDNAWVLFSAKGAEGGRPPLPNIAAPFAKDHLFQNMAFVIKPLGKPVAIGFFGGDAAAKLEGLCKDKEHGSGPKNDCDMAAIALSEWYLNSMYPGAAGKAVENQIQLTRWSLDPTSYGAYSIAEPLFWPAHEELSKSVYLKGTEAHDCEDAPCKSPLFFAGEATSRGIYIGSYPGAYESGIRAAREINAEMLDAKDAK